MSDLSIRAHVGSTNVSTPNSKNQGHLMLVSQNPYVKIGEPIEFKNKEQFEEYEKMQKSNKRIKRAAFWTPTVLGAVMTTIAANRAKTFGGGLLGLAIGIGATVGAALLTTKLADDYCDNKKAEFAEKVHNENWTA